MAYDSKMVLYRTGEVRQASYRTHQVQQQANSLELISSQMEIPRPETGQGFQAGGELPVV